MLGLRPDSSLEEHSSVIQVLSHISGFGGLRNCPPLIDGVLIRENGAVDWKEICLDTPYKGEKVSDNKSESHIECQESLTKTPLELMISGWKVNLLLLPSVLWSDCSKNNEQNVL